MRAPKPGICSLAKASAFLPESPSWLGLLLQLQPPGTCLNPPYFFSWLSTMSPLGRVSCKKPLFQGWDQTVISVLCFSKMKLQRVPATGWVVQARSLPSPKIFCLAKFLALNPNSSSDYGSWYYPTAPFYGPLLDIFLILTYYIRRSHNPRYIVQKFYCPFLQVEILKKKDHFRSFLPIIKAICGLEQQSWTDLLQAT